MVLSAENTILKNSAKDHLFIFKRIVLKSSLRKSVGGLMVRQIIYIFTRVPLGDGEYISDDEYDTRYSGRL